MRVTKVFLFTFSGLFNRQRIHNLFKNQMITNLAIQLNVCNSQCSLETCLLSLLKCPHGTCFHFCNAPLRPVCFHPHPHGTCFYFYNAPLRPGLYPHHDGTWLSLFKCVLTRHGERIGYLCHRCLKQLNLPTSR